MVSYRIIGILWATAAILLLFMRISASEAGRHTRRNAESTGYDDLKSRKSARTNSRTSNKDGQPNTRNRGRPKHERPGKSLPDFVAVRTKKGSYRGKVYNILETRVAGFLGMRYGESAAGRKRFRKPEPATKWSEIRDATSYPRSCFQWTDNTFGEGYAGTEMWNTNTEKSEDCLFLNVWTPLGTGFRGNRLKSSKKRLPVMVWIFGGGFYSGTSSLDVYQGQWLAASQEVVVVSMNYRVAAFGFLALGIEEAPGNVGLWDQNLALLWIRDNIHHFHGDKDRITLFGESAGAASVSMHVLSDKSNTLFKNAIMHSASALSPWALLSKAKMRRRALLLAQSMGCNDTNASLSEVVSCLTTRDAQTLADTEIYMEDLGTARFQNAAIIDEDFLTEDVINQLKNKTFSTSINMLTGFNGNEGNYFLVYSTDGFTSLRGDPISYAQYDAGLNKGLWGYPWSPFNESDQQKEGGNSSEIIIQAINFLYTDFQKTVSDSLNSPNVPSDNMYKPALDHIAGDLNFICPAIGFMDDVISVTEMPDEIGSGGRDLNVTRGRKYLYRFLHRSSQTPWPEWMGTLHGYEIEFAFGIPLNTSLNYTDLEKNLSKKMLTYWANFAKAGNPNGDDGGESLTRWPEYHESTKFSLVFDIATTGELKNQTDVVTYVEKGTKHRHCQFWNTYYPLLWESTRPCTDSSLNGSAKGVVLTRLITCVLPAFVTLLLINI